MGQSSFAPLVPVLLIGRDRLHGATAQVVAGARLCPAGQWTAAVPGLSIGKTLNQVLMSSNATADTATTCLSQTQRRLPREAI